MRWWKTMWILSLLGAVSASAAELVPFVLPWDDASRGPTNVRDWLDRPAGKDGYVEARSDGHLYVGDRRLRLFGVNFVFGACFPQKEDAEKIAARLAKFGINAVRFHHMDNRVFPDGIRRRGIRNTRALDPEALDRLDYFIDQLKRHGIYSDLNLLVSRPFVAADGLPQEIESIPWKERHVVGFFDEKMIALQEEYARQLLAHRNPYTKRSYAEEPAVAIVEINNENGLVHAWFGGRVDRLPQVFRDELAAQWNDWLKTRYGSSGAMRGAWNVLDEPLGDEMLRNGDFADGTAGWTLEQHEGARADIATFVDGPGGSGAVRIRVAQLGSAGWHVQFNQGGLPVEAGKPYTLTFRAKAAQPATILVALGQAHEPWGGLGFQKEIELTNEWQTFSFVFAPNRDDANARVNFSNLGRAIGTYWFADGSLRPGGTLGLREGEELEKGTVPIFTRDGYGERTADAQRDWIRFLWETERNYWQRLYRYLKEELGVRAPIVGTIVGNGPPNLMAELDVVDTHAYWQHPRFPGRPWDPANWHVNNVSMVNEKGGVLPRLAQRRIVGKPHLVTEYNHAAPNTYSSEAPLLLAAFAGLQDWDGVFLFAYSHRRDDWDARQIRGFFDIDQHPTKMANLPIAAALFLRGDMRLAEKEIVADLSAEREIDLLSKEGRAWQLVDAGNLGVSPVSTLVHRVALRVGEEATDGLSGPEPVSPDGTRFTSDTGELVWDVSHPGKGVVTMNTPRTKAVVGFADGRSFALGDVTITPGATSQDWATIGLTLLEGDSFAGKGRILLVATGSAENTKMGWKDAERTTVGRDWGEAPSRVEVVPATITLPVSPERVRAWALDDRGQRAEALVVGNADGKALLSIGLPHRTLWYEVRIE